MVQAGRRAHDLKLPYRAVISTALGSSRFHHTRARGPGTDRGIGTGAGARVVPRLF